MIFLVWKLLQFVISKLVLLSDAEARHFFEHFVTTADARWPEPLVVIPAISHFACLTVCHLRTNCASVNFNETSNSCEQNGFTPGLTSAKPNPAPGWLVITRITAYPLNMAGATAWQSSTNEYNAVEKSEASNGIDGNISSNFDDWSCFHTGYDDPYDHAFWVVELVAATRFRGVTVYYRDDECCTDRIAELHFLVSESRADYDVGISTEVAYYKGPPNGSYGNPLMLFFPAQTFGKVLKIEQQMDSVLSLCEVILLIP